LTTLSRIVKEAFEIQTTEFIKTVQEVTRKLGKEEGKVGNFYVKGRLVKTEPVGEAVIIGDLHGDVTSLIEVLQRSKIVERMERSRESFAVFLGDYGDRGACPAETYYTVLKLKLLFPKQVILMRGNHEGPKDLLPSPHDLPEQFQARFKENGAEAYVVIRRMFDNLFAALIVHKLCLMVHGGLPAELEAEEDLAHAYNLRSPLPFLEEILWNDPDETIEETAPSPRGAGNLFGKNVTKRILAKLNVKILIRGHEPCEEGFKINHTGKVLTLFSCKGPPYFNTHGAYLDMKFESDFKDAKDLIPYIHKF